MTSTGVVGGRWRATVTEWGAVEPWDGSNTIDWFVAADDRWHRPQHESSTRQTLLRGTPVVETRVRIPSGDAVQRVYSVADAGGLTIIEVTNESTLPIAVAFTGGGLLSRRPPTAMPPQGIDLQSDAVVYPIGHQAMVVVARAHGAAADAVLTDTVFSADQVARGWLDQTQRASRLQLPDMAMVEAVTAARCELLLNGPSTAADIDPVTFLLGVAELVRMGDRASIWVPDVAAQLERLARSGAQIPDGVFEAAGRVLHAAGEHTALADLRRMNLASRPDSASDVLPVEPGCVPSWVERQLVVSDEHSAQLMPKSFPPAWLGVDFEAHGLAIGLASRLSFAIRWHGERPAVLWEVAGPPMPLTHGAWATGQLSGEALWPACSELPNGAGR
ncbi:MAG: hypothetical protein M3P52_04385 [Actinomycetota bacterium]|nr:hypothetical protein [Actinomycetota bacterium]